MERIGKRKSDNLITSFFKRQNNFDDERHNDVAGSIIESSVEECEPLFSSNLSCSDASLPSDLSGKDESKVVPDKVFTFPTKAIGGKLRSCAHHWFQDYSWLEYSVEKDAVFCKPCRHFSRASKSGDHDGVFTLAGFSNWKKMNEKLEKHQGSNVHADSVVKSISYNTTKLDISGTISEQLTSYTNIELRKLITGDQEHLEFVIDLILFHARQDLPLRGHHEGILDEDSKSNRGNFLELHDFLIKYSPLVKSAYDRATHKMLSPTVQNKILMAAENVELQMIKDELDDGKYAILSDATRSAAHKEVEVLVLRYLHNKCLYERTVGLVDISKDQTAQGIAIAIQEILSPIELNPSQCVGFSFDGASVMSGPKGGVQAILKKY